MNTLLSSAKQQELEALVAEQIYEKEQNSLLMIDILSHIVEFRNGESGRHVVHVRKLTEVLLKRLVQKTGQYKLTLLARPPRFTILARLPLTIKY